MKIGVIGDKTSIQGFSALSIDIFPATTEAEVRRGINKMVKEDYVIIFITEQAAVLAEETINKYKTDPTPAIIPIPNNKGTLNLGMSTIRKNVEKAVGTDIFFD